MSIPEITQKLLVAKRDKGLSFADLEKILGRDALTKIRPSGHEISDKFQKNNHGAIPPNLLEIANTESNIGLISDF